MVAYALLATNAQLDAQVAVSTEIDSNAKRLPSGTIDGPYAIDTTAIAPDGLLRADSSLRAAWRTDAVALDADGATGLKLFFTQATERMAVGQARLSLRVAQLPLHTVGTASALIKARAQLSGERSYTVARVDTGLQRSWLLSSWDLAVQGGVNVQGFHAFDNALLSAAQAEAFAGLRVLPTRAERFELTLASGPHVYPFATATAPLAVTNRRTDVNASATLAVSSARRIVLGAAYVLSRNSSSAANESYTRHRVSAVVGFALPQRITCSAHGALQITQYDAGVSGAQVYFLGDDEDNQNTFEVQLARPLLGGISIEARGGVMGNELAVQGARFFRQVAAIGLRAEL